MKYITCKPHGGFAGVGHQFCNWLVPYILAKKYDLKFVHQPFAGETDGTYAPKGSNANQITRPVKEWNDFLNLGEGELNYRDLPKELFYVIQMPYVDQEEASWNHEIYQTIKNPVLNDVLYRISEEKDGQFLCIDWDFYRNNDLKKKYNNSEQVKDFKNYFDPSNTNIAIAIRRGDVTEDQQYRRWMGLEYYLKIIDKLADIKELKNIIFHIYSWDMPEEEKNELLLHQLFGKRRFELHINEDVFSTFYHFTKADIFVSGQGTFSLMANYLTDAVKLTTPFYMHWNNFPEDIQDLIPVNPDSTFDSEKLLIALEIKNEQSQ